MTREKVVQRWPSHRWGLILALGVMFSGQAKAELFDTWGFVTGEGGDPVMNQLSVDVTSHGTNQVLFTFTNSGPSASSITGLYFDDGALLGIANVLDAEYDPLLYPGVDFTQDALDSVAPPNLPGWDQVNPDFQTSAGFSADSDSPVQPNGVNPAESVGIVFDLQSGKTFDDIIAAIQLGFTDPADYIGDWYSDSLRIGVHVQGIGEGDYSHSYILTPVPGAVILGLLGLSVVGLKLRKYA